MATPYMILEDEGGGIQILSYVGFYFSYSTIIGVKAIAHAFLLMVRYIFHLIFVYLWRLLKTLKNEVKLKKKNINKNISTPKHHQTTIVDSFYTMCDTIW